jgi:hyaluronate lyase
LDYYHSPGTTTEQGTVSTPSTTDQSFVGGADVQDSNGFPAYGMAAFSLHPALKTGTSTLYGKKSYFMFKDEVVCLGSGITAGSANEIHTTVENRALGSSVSSATLWVNGVQTSRALGSGATLSSLSSCAIEGLGGYCFYNSPGNVQAAFQQSSGTWGAIHPGDSDTNNYTNNYLKLYFNHGKNPANATYAYAILPTMAPSAVAGYARNPQSTIVANTTSIQAVKNPVLGTVAANFWGSSGGTADIITANRACSVITYETAGRMSVGISDPSQSLSGLYGIITVTLNRVAKGTITVDSGVTVVRTTPTIQLQANVAGLHGATLHASFSLDPVPVITSNANMVGINGKPLSFQVAADNSPTLYGAIGLPAGLSINTATGVISGSPTENGTFISTLSASNSAGTGYANLTITVAAAASDVAFPYNSSATWTCPANVTALQVECWGGGGAGGSAIRGTSKGAVGGGGAGGAYARLNSFPVVSGRTYYINIGAGGISSTNNLATVPGGDSWFNSNNVASTLVLAKGGPGGQSTVTTTSDVFGTGGMGTTSGSIGDVVRAGGSGATSTTNGFGGGGGGSAGTLSTGNAPASTTNGLGALAVTGGGNGGNANATAGSSGDGQSPTGSPGGGGGGARAASTTQRYGGTGAAGQVVLTVVETATAPSTAFASWSGNAAVTSDLVNRYAFGAANKTSAPEKITSSITSTTLSLTAVVRTDDPKLIITPKWATSLSGNWSTSNPLISVVNAADQTGLGAGLVRKVYSVERGIDNRFLKLEAVYTP